MRRQNLQKQLTKSYVAPQVIIDSFVHIVLSKLKNNKRKDTKIDGDSDFERLPRKNYLIRYCYLTFL